jgi:hypothetical protein
MCGAFLVELVLEFVGGLAPGLGACQQPQRRLHAPFVVPLQGLLVELVGFPVPPGREGMGHEPSWR